MTDPMSFDEYCEQHGVTDGEAPAAFAAYLHEITGGEWDDRMEKVDQDELDVELDDDDRGDDDDGLGRRDDDS